MSLISLHWAVIMGRVSTEPGKNEAHTVIQFYDSIGDCSTARDTVPRLQCFTELPEAYPIHHTDRPHVLAYERNTFLRAGLLSSRRHTNLWRTAQNMYPVVAVSLKVHILCHIHVGCTFWRCSLKLLVVEWLANSSLT